MNMIDMVASIREGDGKRSAQTRYSIDNIDMDAQTFAGAVRQRWGNRERPAPVARPERSLSPSALRTHMVPRTSPLHAAFHVVDRQQSWDCSELKMQAQSEHDAVLRSGIQSGVNDELYIPREREYGRQSEAVIGFDKRLVTLPGTWTRVGPGDTDGHPVPGPAKRPVQGNAAGGEGLHRRYIALTHTGPEESYQLPGRGAPVISRAEH